MKTIHIFEEGVSCCGPSQSANLLSFLERKYRGVADVKAFDLANGGGRVPVPASLLAMMQIEGPSCLPAVVVDGVVVASGKLPNFLDAIQLISGSSSANGSTV